MADPQRSFSRLLDPDTQTTYVLVPEEVYERMKHALLDEDFLIGSYAHAMEVFGKDGWDDPSMDDYNELDPRKTA